MTYPTGTTHAHPSRHVAGPTGPGAFARDGSAVELYRLLTPRGEQAIVHGAIGEGAVILELGCGAGRLTRPLAELGHEIVAVDECEQMLRHVPDEHAGMRIRKICATIQDLRLAEEFDAVLLASNLITTCGPATRKQLLDTCRRHLSPRGAVLIEQHDPGLFAAPLRRERGDRAFAVRDIVRDQEFVSATLETHVAGTAWTQRVTVQSLTDQQLRQCLRESSLGFDTYLTQDRTWFRAVRRPAED